jgi:DNA-binding NtrC family response regulator
MEVSGQILLVEDDMALREMLVELLREEGLEVRAVADADDALVVAREMEFDVVLSDIEMPQMDGFELLEALKKLRPNARVILMTSFGSSTFVTRAVLGGALDYLSKPFSREQLGAALERALAA